MTQSCSRRYVRTDRHQMGRPVRSRALCEKERKTERSGAMLESMGSPESTSMRPGWQKRLTYVMTGRQVTTTTGRGLSVGTIIPAERLRAGQGTLPPMRCSSRNDLAALRLFRP